jgi:predicted AlkP superfamily pyrophosphatase or phosphodiesterase
MRQVRTLVSLLALLGFAPRPAPTRGTRLIVQITMDQLRGSLLRDDTAALTHGFRRLEIGGYWIRHADVAHGLTVSFPGHTTLASGMYPTHHGLTANEWWQKIGDRWSSVDVTDDSSFQLLGDTAHGIGASPRYLSATTLAEWVKRADPHARAIALGTGNRIPIAYGGRRADAVYWYDARLNRFTTSTFYSSTMVDWVKTFNETELPGFEQRVWSLTVPAPLRSLGPQEPAAFWRRRTFPHLYDSESVTQDGQPRSYPSWFTSTPMKDEALFALAARAVDAEHLGQRGSLDYLAIDVDATDNVGHTYGPRSLEQLDALVRLDRALGAFLDHLDATVGRDHYVVALSADHGAAEPPETVPGGRRIARAEIDSLLDRVDSVAAPFHGSREALADSIAAVLVRSEFVADAYTEKRLSEPSTDSLVQLYQRVFRPGHTADFPLWGAKPHEHHPARYGVFVRFKPNMIFDYAVSVHGSPYPYDRDVPILFYGAGIRQGSRETDGRTVDVAPTLAVAADLAPPAGLDGVPLTFALKRPRADQAR